VLGGDDRDGRDVPLMRLALALVMVAGCVPATGTILEVEGPMGTTSTAAGIATLELVVAYSSFCDRWVQDQSASRTKVSVAGRDLDKRPYEFLVAPSHQTDLTQPAYLAVLAYSATGELLGEATFGRHPFDKDKVYKHQARVRLFPASVRTPSGPKYVAGDGCVCVPGEPWLGTATGRGCDTRVITSLARLGDTAGCELTPTGAPLPVPVCDGQHYPNEPPDRALPCWAADGTGACRLKTRACADHDGQAWAEECVSDGGDFAMPAGSQLCARYLACEQTACGDVTGCFVQSLGTPQNVACTMRIDPATGMGQPIKPCTGASWRAAIPPAASQSCVGTVVQGTDQPPFTLGFAVAGGTTAQSTGTQCPLLFQIDNIDAPYPMAVPSGKIIDVVVGERLLHVYLNVVLACAGSEPSLVCHLAP
jgi:hypothetical protein